MRIRVKSKTLSVAEMVGLVKKRTGKNKIQWRNVGDAGPLPEIEVWDEEKPFGQNEWEVLFMTPEIDVEKAPATGAAGVSFADGDSDGNEVFTA